MGSIIVIEYIDNETIRVTFPEEYNIVTETKEEANASWSAVDSAVELDEVTGLPIIEKETILSKYGLETDPSNSFHKSLRAFFDKAGFLTDKQLSALR